MDLSVHVTIIDIIEEVFYLKGEHGIFGLGRMEDRII